MVAVQYHGHKLHGQVITDEIKKQANMPDKVILVKGNVSVATIRQVLLLHPV